MKQQNEPTKILMFIKNMITMYSDQAEQAKRRGDWIAKTRAETYVNQYMERGRSVFPAYREFLRK